VTDQVGEDSTQATLTGDDDDDDWGRLYDWIVR